MLSLFCAILVISCFGSDDDNPQSQLPTVSTAEISGIANTTAGAGGTVTDDGGSAIITRGVVWSTAENPTTADNKTSDGTGVGSYPSVLTGLSANTTYYIRAYATNSGGTAYGNQRSFTTTNVPAEGTTVEYIVDVETIFGTRIYNPAGDDHRVCHEVAHAKFDMDPYARSYTVHFFDLMRTLYGSTTPEPFPDLTYSFAADAGIEIIYAGTFDGTWTYLTDYYSIGNAGAVTRDTQANKLYCNLSWCAGEGVCNGPDPCHKFTGKAKITVHY